VAAGARLEHGLGNRGSKEVGSRGLKSPKRSVNTLNASPIGAFTRM
jgi:hypothetical protein